MSFAAKLIETALPLEEINRAGRAEKAVPKKGHPATMHLWWSRKPLGVARAVLFASLVDDPSARPDRFPSEEDQAAERARLFNLVAKLAEWDAADDEALLAAARQRIRADVGDRPIRVIDPFCGGGTIPIEALRLGLDTLAADLNPVAALLAAAATRIAQRFAGLAPTHPGAMRRLAVPHEGLAGIAEDVELYGSDVEAECARRLGREFADVASPASPGGRSTPVSYLWTRTVNCSNPCCRRETPLLSTWWLSKKTTRPWHVRPQVEGDRFTFAVHEGSPPEDLRDLKAGRGANFRCLFCGEVNDADTIRAQGSADGLGLRLVAIQVFRDSGNPRSGRVYVDPDPQVEQIALSCVAPETANTALSRELPEVCGNVRAYGIKSFADLLTPRQRLTMGTFVEVIGELRDTIRTNAIEAGMGDDSRALCDGGVGASAYADAIITYLALTLSRMANRTTTMTIHNRANGSVEQSFVQPAYGFYGDFPEANPFSGSTGSWSNSLEHVCAAIRALPVTDAHAEVRATSAISALPETQGIICTDPPYYDMFDYAALSNLFYVWLRALLAEVWPDMFGSLLAPAAEQIVSNPARFGGNQARAHEHFEQLLREAFTLMRKVQTPRFPMMIYYGYQQAERSTNGWASTAWEVLLESMIDAGLQITATWPLRTERPEGVKKGSNSMASSILLVCRPAPNDLPTATTAEFRSELQVRLPDALRLLQQGNVAPVDLAQAAIGPGMTIFSRYSKVVEADGSPMRVRTALELINQVLDETLADCDSQFDNDTRWAVTWFENYGMGEGTFDRAEQLSKAYNTSVESLARSGFVAQRPGKVWLVPREELANDWDPTANKRLTAWEVTQHLIRRLETDGKEAAALLAQVGVDLGETAKQLAYRLYLICDRKGWAAEARGYNSLVMAWPELIRLASNTTPTGKLTMAV